MQILFTQWHKLLAVLIFATLSVGNHSAAQTQYPNVPTQNGFPVLGSCNTTQTYPMFASEWQAKTLLTPFDSSQLVFAQVAVSDTLNAMRVTTKGVTDGVVQDLLFRADGSATGLQVFELGVSSTGMLTCQTFGGAGSNWKIPQPQALAQSDCTCQGTNPVLGVDAQAWACKNGKDLPGSTTAEYDWYWTAPNGDPVRFLFSRDNNEIGLPVLGEFSMVHFTDYQQSVPSTFGDALAVCSNAVPEIGAQIPDPTIAGVSGQEPVGFQLPIWPTKIYSNGALTAVDGSFTQMSIYYDYDNLQEVSRIRYPEAWPAAGAPVNGFINDTRLTKGETLEIAEIPGQAPTCQGILKNVGIWHPDWAHRDGCQFRANIAAGSALNQSNQDIHALSCFFANRPIGQARIDAWYDESGAPHMFYESNATDLDLIDYYAFDRRTSFAPNRFDHPSCAGKPIQDMGTTCTACHGASQ